ncbi:MAG: hypothetical protein ACD_37C00084G0002 [uncultured bacterium]|nr:MAG: hypothetical protein ACD_37C00084G0002 [uncultured bacterium]
MQISKLVTGNKKPKQYINQNPVEALRGIGSEVKDSVLDELGKTSVMNAWDQLLGIDSNDSKQSGSHGGDLSAGQELDLTNVKKEVHKLTEQGEEFVREIVHAGKKAASEESREIQVKIHEIIIEIKQLANSSQQLRKQVEVIAMEQTGETTGQYHVSFLENALQWIRDARMNVEDSLAWFSALRSKKAARQYGAMAKKRGTSFTLSNERTVSTQVG